MERAFKDCEITIKDIDAIVIGNMDHFESINYVDTWSVEGSGGYMKPIMKVTTGGTTGTSVAIAAYYHVASGLFDKVLAIGWEKNSESDTTGAIITCSDPIWDRFSYSGAIPSLATEASAYMEQYGATQQDAARVAVRERTHAMNNPYAQLHGRPITIQDVMESAMLAYPIKLLDVCPRTDGACAVVFAAEGRAEKDAPKPAWIKACSVRHAATWFGDVDYNTGLLSLPEGLPGGLRKGGHSKSCGRTGCGRALSSLFLCRAQVDRGARFLRDPVKVQIYLGREYRYGRQAPHQSLRRGDEYQLYRSHRITAHGRGGHSDYGPRG